MLHTVGQDELIIYLEYVNIELCYWIHLRTVSQYWVMLRGLRLYFFKLLQCINIELLHLQHVNISVTQELPKERSLYFLLVRVHSHFLR